MPPQPAHIPSAHERAALQKLLARPTADLHPAGKKTTLNLKIKGWIEGPAVDGTYSITEAGINAMRIPLTAHRRKLRRFVETSLDGTGRLAYTTVISMLPDPIVGFDWREDRAFNAAESILSDPGLKELYAAALRDGCAIADQHA